MVAVLKEVAAAPVKHDAVAREQLPHALAECDRTASHHQVHVIVQQQVGEDLQPL
jgi:hypothetical protein